MERQPVVSTNVAQLGYDPDSQTLEVEFQSDAVYQGLSGFPNDI